MTALCPVVYPINRFFHYLYVCMRMIFPKCFIDFCLVFQSFKDIFHHLPSAEVANPGILINGTVG
jgi:hypothetical protein